jgi:N-methylhydantoinase A
MIQALPAGADTAQVQALTDELRARGEAELRAEGVEGGIESTLFVDLCYQGQSFHLDIPWEGDPEGAEAAFHERHEQRYGHRLALPVEWAHVRVRLQAKQAVQALPERPRGAPGTPRSSVRVAGGGDQVPVYERVDLAPGQRLSGPALICEPVATTWLAPDWSLTVSAAGHLLLDRRRE